MKTMKKVLAILFVLAVLAPATVLAATPSGSKKNIAESVVTTTDLTYNGTAQTSKVVVKDGTKVLVAGTDYKVTGNVNTKAGTYTVTITGMGAYQGTTTKTYKIAAKSADGVKVTTASKVYNGKKQTANVVVKDGTKVLVKGTDYTLSRSYRTGAGTTKITVTFKGNYAGTKSTSFTVKKAAQSYKLSGVNSVKASTVKKASKKYRLHVKGVKANAKVTYKSNSKKITVSSKGVITVKKGTKKGTKAVITVTTKATANYKATTKTIVFTVK